MLKSDFVSLRPIYDWKGRYSWIGLHNSILVVVQFQSNSRIQLTKKPSKSIGSGFPANLSAQLVASSLSKRRYFFFIETAHSSQQHKQHLILQKVNRSGSPIPIQVYHD